MLFGIAVAHLSYSQVSVLWTDIQVEGKKGSKITRRIAGEEEEGDRVRGKTEKTKRGM